MPTTDIFGTPSGARCDGRIRFSRNNLMQDTDDLDADDRRHGLAHYTNCGYHGGYEILSTLVYANEIARRQYDRPKRAGQWRVIRQRSPAIH